MTNDIVLEVGTRSDSGKNASRRLRRAGEVPGIVYGLDRPPFSVAVNSRKLDEILHLEAGRNTILTLVMTDQPDKKRAVMIRDLQRDPVKENVLHVDFVRVDLEKRIKVNVPIRLVGVPVGVKTELGVIEFVTREIEVECLPGDIPDHLEVDVSELHVNQHIAVSDLRVAANVEVLDAPETIIAVVAAPRAEVPAAGTEEEEGAPEGAAEPEVVTKGKEAGREKPESGD